MKSAPISKDRWRFIATSNCVAGAGAGGINGKVLRGDIKSRRILAHWQIEGLIHPEIGGVELDHISRVGEFSLN